MASHQPLVQHVGLWATLCISVRVALVCVFDGKECLGNALNNLEKFIPSDGSWAFFNKICHCLWSRENGWFPGPNTA